MTAVQPQRGQRHALQQGQGSQEVEQAAPHQWAILPIGGPPAYRRSRNGTRGPGAARGTVRPRCARITVTLLAGRLMLSCGTFQIVTG